MSKRAKFAEPVPPAPTTRTREPARVFSVPTEMPWGETVDEAWLDRVIDNWNKYQAKGDPRFPKPPAYVIPQASVGLGHNEDQAIARAYAERSDLPAVGWPTELSRDGNVLVCHFEGVPVKLSEWINAKAYRSCSAEFYENYGGFGPCLRRVSLTGAEIPAKKDLGDLPVMVFDDADLNKPNPIAFTETLAQFAKGRSRFAASLGGGLIVTFTETSPPGAVTMNPQQQALFDALSKLGIDMSKLDGAALDSILAACTPAPAPPAPAPQPPALNTEDDDDDPKGKPAMFTEKDLEAAIAKALAPMQTQLKTLDTQLANATAKLTAQDQATERARMAAFCESHKDKIFPYELDGKVGPTLVDQLLALPDQIVATFAEGKMSPRAAFMKSIESRPPIAKFAERIPQDLQPNKDAEVNQLLGMTRLGQAALRAQAAKA